LRSAPTAPATTPPERVLRSRRGARFHQAAPGRAGASGLALRHGISLVNAPGLIDAGYRGELRVLLLNTDRVEPFEVGPGDRIAQLLLTPFAPAEPFELAELSTSARGEGGFGSSGR
jgi:dUTP pyrophosphatase